MRHLMISLTVLVAIVSAPSLAEADSAHHIAGDHYFGCQSEEYFGKLISYAVDGDQEAFRNALAAGVLVGECTLFEKGEVVYIVKAKIFSGRVKVRRKGETAEYWTVTEAVD